MKEYGNNGIFGAQMKQMDGKQEIYLEWPKIKLLLFYQKTLSF